MFMLLFLTFLSLAAFVEAQHAAERLCANRSQGHGLLSAVQTMGEKDVRWLTDGPNIAGLVREVGLVYSSYNSAKTGAYGNESKYMIPRVVELGNMPGKFTNPGMYQVPMQLACALTTLASLKISSFLEVGTWSGWTGVFVSTYLQRLHKLHGGLSQFWSASTDIRDARTECIKSLAQSTPHEYQGVNRKIELRGMPPVVDLCFIDGDHSYQGAHHDVTMLMQRCRYIMLHDIVDIHVRGVAQQWQELVAQFNQSFQFECLQEPDGLSGIMGIGAVQVASGPTVRWPSKTNR